MSLFTKTLKTVGHFQKYKFEITEYNNSYVSLVGFQFSKYLTAKKFSIQKLLHTYIVNGLTKGRRSLLYLLIDNLQFIKDGCLVLCVNALIMKLLQAPKIVYNTIYSNGSNE